MRNKILSSFTLFIGLSAIYLTMSSDKTGKYSGGTSCGSCHGNANSATTVSLTGLPTSYITGQTYNLTFTISNATNTKSGFNVYASGGSFVAGSGSKTSGTQITHSAVSSSLVYNFSWKAPSTPGSVTFKGVGNAVNGNNSDDSGDQWNTMSDITISGTFPVSTSDVVDNSDIKIYPNPCTDQVQIDNAQDVTLINIAGQQIPVQITDTEHTKQWMFAI